MNVATVVIAMTLLWASISMLERFPLSTPSKVNGFLLSMAPMAVLILLVALRPPRTPTGDTVDYVRAFLALDNVGDAREVGLRQYGNSEFLYWPLQALLKLVVPDVRSWLIVNAALIAILMAAAYRSLAKAYDLPHYILLAPASFLTYFTVYAGNGMRQALAIPILLIGLGWTLRGQRVKAVLSILIASTLHLPSAIFLFLPVLQSIPRSRLLLTSIPVIALVLGSSSAAPAFLSAFSLGGGLRERYDLYVVGGVESTAGSPLTSINLIICAALVATLLATVDVTDEHDFRLTAFSSLTLSTVFLTLSIDEVWVRSMVVLYALTPLILTRILVRFRWKELDASVAFAIFHVALFLGWIFRDSTASTLGF